MLYLTTKRVFENLGGLLPGCPLYLRAWCLCERRYSDRTTILSLHKLNSTLY